MSQSEIPSGTDSLPNSPHRKSAVQDALERERDRKLKEADGWQSVPGARSPIQALGLTTLKFATLRQELQHELQCESTIAEVAERFSRLAGELRRVISTSGFIDF